MITNEYVTQDGLAFFDEKNALSHENSILEKNIKELKDTLEKVEAEKAKFNLKEKPKFKVGDEVIVNGATKSGVITYVTPRLNGHFYCDVKYADGVNTFDESVLNFAPVPEEVKPKFKIGDEVVSTKNPTIRGRILAIRGALYYVAFGIKSSIDEVYEWDLDFAPKEVNPGFQTIDDVRNYISNRIKPILESVTLEDLGFKEEKRQPKFKIGQRVRYKDSTLYYVDSFVTNPEKTHYWLSDANDKVVLNAVLEEDLKEYEPKFKVGDYVERNNERDGGALVEIKEICYCVNGTIFYRVAEKPSSDGYYVSEEQLTGKDKSSAPVNFKFAGGVVSSE